MMKAKGLITTVALTTLLCACDSSCDQQAFAERLQRVQDLMLVVKKSNDIETIVTIKYEHLAQLDEVERISADDLGQACDILDEMLEEL